MYKNNLWLYLIPCLLSFMYFSAESQEIKRSIAGTITERKSGEYVIGITVTLLSPDTTNGKKVLRGIYTNKFGFYSFPNLNPGTYLMSVNGMGYEKYLKEITLSKDSDLQFDINLITKDIKTGDVIVEADRESSPTSKIGAVEIEPTFISKLPAFGEVDVFRSLQLLPGVSQSSELSSGLYVRGGSPDQNLTLLDGVIVYNPNHLGGFLSTFNTDAISHIKLIKGAFPAEYGGRLSSVLDMTMKEGTKEKISGYGGISLITSRLLVEGPITEDMTFMISGRRMYLDLLVDLVNLFDLSDADYKGSFGYYFYDLNAKLNYKISKSDRIFVSGFFGRDVLSDPESIEQNDEKFDIFWGNKTGNLRWMHIVSPTLFTNFSLIFTDYSFNTDISENVPINETDFRKEELNIFSGIKDMTLKADAQYFPLSNHIIKTGIEATWHGFRSYIHTSINSNITDLRPEDDIKTLDAAIFVQDEWAVTPLLNTNLGLRGYYFQEGNYFNLEPRISANYDLTENIALTGAFAVANQYLHLLIRNDITLPTDLWFPSTKDLQPSKSYQGSLGIQSLLFNNEYKFTVETYYKDMGNIYEYKDNTDFNFGMPSINQLVSGRGESYGLEFFLNKQYGEFTGWIGYTLAWTKRYFNELNNGKWFYPRHDRRHDISIVLDYKASKDINLSAVWIFATGQAYTMPSGKYVLDYQNVYDYDKYQFTERNGSRLPSYHRLDVNITFNYEWFNLPWQFYISIYNLYNQKNPFAWDIDYDNNRTVVKQFTLFPIIPTFGFNFKF